jgi:hypothetical protein
MQPVAISRPSKKGKMCEQMIIQDANCLCSENHQKERRMRYLQLSRVEAAGSKQQALAEETLDTSRHCTVESAKGNFAVKLLERIAILREILFAYQDAGIHISKNGDAPLPMLIHASNGCSVQPVLWNPGGFYSGKSR